MFVIYYNNIVLNPFKTFVLTILYKKKKIQHINELLHYLLFKYLQILSIALRDSFFINAI